MKKQSLYCCYSVFPPCERTRNRRDPERPESPAQRSYNDAESAAKVISERDVEIKKDIKIEHEKKKKDSICDLKTSILDAKLESEKEKNNR